ncbi:MAG: hypothetical protein H8E68_08385 [Kiritimatiellaeota bacterium]|nr:hypothetical protein [Kiritimatiellota bacterium]
MQETVHQSDPLPPGTQSFAPRSLNHKGREKYYGPKYPVRKPGAVSDNWAHWFTIGYNCSLSG